MVRLVSVAYKCLFVVAYRAAGQFQKVRAALTFLAQNSITSLCPRSPGQAGKLLSSFGWCPDTAVLVTSANLSWKERMLLEKICSMVILKKCTISITLLLLLWCLRAHPWAEQSRRTCTEQETFTPKSLMFQPTQKPWQRFLKQQVLNSACKPPKRVTPVQGQEARPCHTG